jgi:hypothetical protein
MKSQFTNWPYLLAILSVAFSVVIAIAFYRLISNPSRFIGPFVPFALFFGYAWVWMVLIELRTKAISITIAEGEIRVRRFIGLSTTIIYPFQILDGYQLSILKDRFGDYEYLYLMSGDKKAVKISEKFHSNYQELKTTVINLGFKNLGLEY